MDITYEKFIEKNSLSYQIIKMRYTHGKSYNEIANYFARSKSTIQEKCNSFPRELYVCYYLYLKKLGLKINATDILDFYVSLPHAVAYLEKTYSEPLKTFRGNKPPIFLGIENFPPYKKLTDKELLFLEKKVIAAREMQNRTFIDIGNELHITKMKARDIYEHYYHKKVLKAIKIIERYTEYDFATYIFKSFVSPHKRWELITKNYSYLIQDLID